MKYKKISTEEYDIHLIKNSDFHTIDFRVFFAENVNKELITYRNALVSILTYATKKYDTKEKLIKRCQDLYSLRPTALTVRSGNLLITKFGISIVDSEYVDKSNLLNNILLLKDIILNPLVENNKFSSKYFNTVKKELEIETLEIDEEPRLYANIHLLDLLNHDNNLLSGYSDLNILKEMTEESLYNSYCDLISNSKIDIFISGNINEKEIVQMIKNNFSFPNRKIILNERLITHQVLNDKIRIVKETKEYQQSKLSIGFKFYNLTDYENRYVSFIFNSIFGGGANSILMRLIREENSLCYYIGSYNNRLDNILIVNSGINKKNYEKVLEFLKKALKDIELGKFSIKDINIAKMETLFELSNILESNRSIIDYYYGQVLFGSDDLKTRINMIKKISKEDIMKLSKKMKLEAIFFLEGDI